MEEIENNHQEVIFDLLHATAYQDTPLAILPKSFITNKMWIQS